MIVVYLFVLITCLIVCLIPASFYGHGYWSARRHSRIVLFLVAAIGCAASSMIAEQAFLRFRGMGARTDLSAFLGWSAPLAVVTGIVAAVLGGIRCSSKALHAISLVLGLIGGFLWTLCVAGLLGPWFGAFSFPVLYFWMLGAAFGLLVGSLYVAMKGGALVQASEFDRDVAHDGR